MTKYKRLHSGAAMSVTAVSIAACVGAGAGLAREGHSLASIGLLAAALVLLAGLVLHVVGRTRRERVLVLGSGPLARRLMREIKARPELGWQVRWLPEPEAAPGARAADGPEPAARLTGLVGGQVADRIIVALADRRGRLPVRALLSERVRGVSVEEASAVYERLTGKIALESLRVGDLLFGDGFKRSPWQRATARVLSVAIAGIGLACAAPLLAILAPLIKLDSRGPVFFHQLRVGLGGRPFELYKLRTMRPEPARTEWERDNRQRLTRVGRWLRRVHVDELPQLWNILRGDMNLVGPRPHPLVNAEMFNRRIPYYELRSLVRPGLTGWAQVRYRYANSLEEEIEKMCYDLYYIRHRSLWLDLRVLPATLYTLFVRPGTEAVPAHASTRPDTVSPAFPSQGGRQ